jgi:endonuclease/exonuclease/phosphatase family metal-dependent hydrolase
MTTQSKVVFWNIWGHRYADGIHDFLAEHNDADVFCLTEVTDASLQQIAKNGSNLVYTGNEAAAQVDGLAQLRTCFGDDREIFYDTADYRTWTCEQTRARFNRVGFGSALLVKSDVTIVDHGSELLDFDDDEIKSRVLQWLVYTKGNTCYLLAHIHGVWIRGNTKGDHAVRDTQSLLVRINLARIANMYDVDKIIFGGDLNLDINTKAIKSMEGEHYRNLIREYGVNNTRTELYRHLGLEGYSMYADYVLVSNNVEVDSFRVHNTVLASDHAPLIVQFS